MANAMLTLTENTLYVEETTGIKMADRLFNEGQRERAENVIYWPQLLSSQSTNTIQNPASDVSTNVMV